MFLLCFSHCKMWREEKKRFKPHAHIHTHIFMERVATLWDSLPSDITEAKNITGEISPIHGRKFYRELLNTKTQIQPLGQEVPVQRLPGAGRMHGRKRGPLLTLPLHPVQGVPCPETGQSTSWPSCTGALLLQGQNLQLPRNLSHVQHPSVP